MKVFYSDRMVCEAQSYSPSAGKPRHVVASWLRLEPTLEIVGPEPVTPEQLELAHDGAFVRGVLACTEPNGFGNRLPEVAASLPYTSGAMLAACREALANGVAIAPVSGFHHACYDEADGFCTFNGLMVAATVLKHENRVARVGILDADHHYGNGTVDIIERLGADWVTHYTLGEFFNRSHHAPRFFDELPAILDRFASCDLLLYQAGADPHIDDPLGGWLTTDQLRLRDRIVFERCRRAGLPLAWNLAGGYQQPLQRVLEIHDNTLRECLYALRA